MKTTINFLIVVAIVCILTTPVTALTIDVSDKGTNFITWFWDNPSNISEMYLDGHLMCGYETTDPSLNVVDLRAGSCHNLTLFTNVGNGTNITCALWGNTSRGGGGESYGNTGATMNNDAIMFGLVGACVGGVVLMGFFLKRRR